MRVFAAVAVLSLLAPLARAADKLDFDDRVELTRGLLAEYANARVLVPRSKKPLEFDARTGSYDKKAWTDIAKQSGPAARTGDTVQITKIELLEDRIVLQINGGFSGGHHWYNAVQVGGSTDGPVSVNPNSDVNSPGGTSIAIVFHKPLEPIKSAEIKKMLAPILDFDRRSVTEIYSETLPPEMRTAIEEKRVLEGMTRDQVIMAMGRTSLRSREVKDGVELEDWVYGTAPGKMTFVTFDGDKVVHVQVEYAGLGTQVDPAGK